MRFSTIFSAAVMLCAGAAALALPYSSNIEARSLGTSLECVYPWWLAVPADPVLELVISMQRQRSTTIRPSAALAKSRFATPKAYSLTARILAQVIPMLVAKGVCISILPLTARQADLADVWRRRCNKNTPSALNATESSPLKMQSHTSALRSRKYPWLFYFTLKKRVLFFAKVELFVFGAVYASIHRLFISSSCLGSMRHRSAGAHLKIKRPESEWRRQGTANLQFSNSYLIHCRIEPD